MSTVPTLSFPCYVFVILGQQCQRCLFLVMCSYCYVNSANVVFSLLCVRTVMSTVPTLSFPCYVFVILGQQCQRCLFLVMCSYCYVNSANVVFPLLCVRTVMSTVPTLPFPLLCVRNIRSTVPTLSFTCNHMDRMNLFDIVIAFQWLLLFAQNGF